ncbi:Clan CA, family C19, ubiquitin hydrolase-like cysteine peptidase [Tritrichomonas foetus]|uniref:Clan CA, family C19, ubiquitin hydrolase-like cysteine peptidase n=1 Tax=Tritrichomonas foetus TaxID=1144522 RepID=A0A1J4KA75_9EUKA|nr:Clan CA, family C19, ubiquitin hydrolase-like cysteine peptidase [Tritrichomonas foetus]|eukprot:OHT06566.1 Clan CA, family C19, ubiquitin hydrolase-like cysteine peptidase [Tritrichomonas foetus]
MNQDFKEWIDHIYSSLSNQAKLSKTYTDLLSQINSIHKTGFLMNEFQNNTDEFIDVYSPRIITEILNLTPSDQLYTQQLNQILEAYINLIPLFLFSNHKKFSKSAQKIVIEKDYPFYSSTVTNSFSFLSSSPYYTSNLKLFLNSDILNTCKSFFEKNENVIPDVYYSVIFLLNNFRTQWDKKTFKSFYTLFVTSFLTMINKIEDNSFRNVNENQIISIFNMLFDIIEQDMTLHNNLLNSQIEFCLRMLCSDYLNKQFCALKVLQTIENIPDDIFLRIKNDQILQKVLTNLHKDLIPGFAWLLKSMVVKGYIDPRHLIELWEITLAKYTSSIDTWADVITDLDPEIEELFWQKVAKTRSFPLTVYPFLRKISNKANESQKKMMFQCLFQQIFTIATTEETENAIVLTIAFYLPRDPDFRSSVQDQCIDLIKNNLHIRFSLSVLKKLAFYFNANESRELFHIFLDIKPNLSENTEQYMEFLVSDMRHFDSVLTEEESKRFESLMTKILPEKSAQVQKFFEDIARTQKVIFPTSFFTFAISRLCSASQNTESYVDLLISLFKEVNRKSFESSMLFNELWIRTVNNLICAEDIWNFLYATSSTKVASFLSKLYSNCRESGALQIFVKKCLREPANVGSLTALAKSIEQREGIDAKKKKINKWEIKDKNLIEVKMFGDYKGVLLLPPQIQPQRLKGMISNFLLLRPDTFTLHLNGKTLPTDTVLFTNESELEIKIIGKDLHIPMRPTSYLKEEESKFLVSLLSSDNQQINETALKIVNILPTVQSEMDILTGEKIDWEKIFDSTHQSLLLYRLNAIGNLLQTDWYIRFRDEGGAEYLYKKLVIEKHLYRSHSIILKILECLIASNDPFFIKFSQKDFEILIDLIFEEVDQNESNSELLFTILKSASVYNYSKLFSVEKFDNLITKSIFHRNKHFRESICSILLLNQQRNKFLLNLLPESDCAFCDDYYQILVDSTEPRNADLFQKLTDLLISHFSHTDDVKKLLFVSPPHEPFVNGILSLLYKINSFSEDEAAKLIQFMIQFIAFNPVYYFSLNSTFFSFLKLLMNNSQSNQKILYEKLHLIHNSININKHTSKILFTASHNRKGLQNLGATCYANSVFQQLFNTYEFRSAFLEARCESEDWTFALQMIFARLMFFPSLFVDTKSFFKVWKGWDGQTVKTHEQQDAVEFLQLILDQINEKIPNIIDIFKGKIQHDTIGVGVDYHAVSEEDFTTLGLEVCDQRDIEDSLTSFLLPDYHNDYSAEDIGKIDVQRFHKIHTAPQILIIQLKRFTYDLKNNRRLKISKKFNFPHHLDITRAMVDQSSKIEYDLIGVVVHIGNASAGHYFSYCKDYRDNLGNNTKSNIHCQWMSCNDTVVKSFDGSLLPELASGEHSSGNMRDDTAYILFYRRSDTSAPISNDSSMNQAVVESLVDEIQDALRSSVLTSDSYSQFIYEISDDEEKGPFIFSYIVKCLKTCKSEKLYDEFINKVNNLVECSPVFANYVTSQLDSHFSMLLENNCTYTREKYSHFLCHAMQYSNGIEVTKLIKFLISKLRESVNYWGNFDDFFLPFLQSVSINTCNSDLLPVIFDFLQIHVPDYVKLHPNEPVYQKINLNNVFKLLVVQLSSSATKEDYKSIIFSNNFLNKWIQSPYHAVAFSQLLRSFVVECPELSAVYFEFLVQNAADLSPESTAGHFAVLINSQAMCNDQQVLWCFKFLRTKSPAYSRVFFEQLTTKIVESKIDFTHPLLLHGDLWINDWLFSLDIDLRRTMRKLTVAVFKDSPTHLHELLILLLSKMPDLCTISLKRKKDLYLTAHGLSLESSLPTNTFYSLLSWTVKKGDLYHELCQASPQLTDTLMAHKSLQIRDNFPMQRLMEVIGLCKPINDVFFQNVSPNKFLSSFSSIECQVEANSTMVFDALKFVPSSLINEVSKSDIFSKLAVYGITQETFISKQLSEYIFCEVNKESAPCLATPLWQRCFHKVLMQDSFAMTSRKILHCSPSTSTIFMKLKCHLSIVEHIKHSIKNGNKIDCNAFELLRSLTDAFKVTFEGKKSWFGKDQALPIKRFWQKYHRMVSNLIKVLMNSTDLTEIDSLSMLLRCVAGVSNEMTILIFEQLAQHQGNILSTVYEKGINSISLLIDVVSELIFQNVLENQQNVVFQFLIDEFCSLIKSNIYNYNVLDILKRRIDDISGNYPNLKPHEQFEKYLSILQEKLSYFV